MKIFQRFIFIIFYFFITSSLALSSNNLKIITKVGNEIITSFDLENKIKTTLLLAGEDRTQSNINQIKNLSLNILINSKLKKEELKKYGIKNNDDSRINKYLKSLAQKLNVNQNDLEALFVSQGLDLDLFIDEIQIEFLWQNLIYQIYSPKIKLDEKAIVEELNKLINEQNSIIEYNLSEIETEIFTDTKLKELFNYIEKFNFEKAAKKYSISGTSLNGGNIGWINSNSLSNQIFTLIKDLKKGQYSKPILRENSILIYNLNDKREILNFNEENLDELKKSMINKQRNDLLNIYSSNHLSIKKNNTLIEYK